MKKLNLSFNQIFIFGTILACIFSLQVESAEEPLVSKSFPITTLINAKWAQSPLYFEIAEYIASENSGLFWSYISDITELDTPLNEYDTESQQYNTAIAVAKTRLSSLQMPLLKLVVSMHNLTPRITAHLQIAQQIINLSDFQCKTIFVKLGNKLICNLADLKATINSAVEGINYSPVETYSFDNIYPGANNNSQTAILYGDFGSREFIPFHKYLTQQALSGKLRYILRHYLSDKPTRRARLSGYGVELHLKSTEYKSQDDAPKPADDSGSDLDEVSGETEVMGFDFKLLKERFPTLSHSLDQFRHTLLQGNEEIAQLKAWQFQDLGLQAASAIAEIQGEEALKILQITAHNFPKQARSLLSYKVSNELRDEVKHNTDVFSRTLNLVPPDGALFLNGLFFDADSLDLNTLVDTVRSEVRILESLHKNNVRGSLATGLLGLDLSISSGREFAIDIRDTAIMWINNIETDSHYRRWPSSIMDLLRPTFPGMLRNVRKNVFNLVIVIDPLDWKRRSIIKMVESFVLHLAPVRLGIVFDTRNADDSTEEDYLAIVCAFNYVTQKNDGRAALRFLTDLFTAVSTTEKISKKLIRNQLRKSFDRLSTAMLEDILGKESDYDYGQTLAREFVERLGFSSSPQALLNGIPVQESILSSDSEFEEAIFSEVMQQTTSLQKDVFRGELSDAENVVDYLMNQPHVMSRLNQRILSGDTGKFLDLTGKPHDDLSNVRALSELSNEDMTATLLHNMQYFGSKNSVEKIGDSELHFLTIWVICDLKNGNCRDLLIHALDYIRTGDSSVRVAFVPNSEGAELGKRNNLNRLVWSATQTLSPSDALRTVLHWLRLDVTEQKNIPNSDIPEALNDILDSTELHMKMLRVYVQRVLGADSSQRLVVANGKLFGPLGHDEKFSIEDFGLIDRFNSLQYADKMRKALQKEAADGGEVKLTSDILLKLYASLVPRESKTRFKRPDDIKDEHSMVKLAPKNLDLPHFDITAIVDPASRSAQKLAPILILLRNALNCDMRVYLLPVSQHSDMPVKNFYRYVVEPEVQFQPNGDLAEGPLAKFVGVPSNSLLTQNFQIPDNWLVEAVRSVYDLDNIKLSEIGGPVHSEFELEYLLLEGHCFDATSGAPPRGLQITLGTKENPTMVDTIVMANLGYFQLKANPGVWELRLREGKSADIYNISLAEGPNTFHHDDITKVVISSLRSHVIKLRVSKRPDKQNEDLLNDDNDNANSGIWNSIASSFGTSSDKDSDEDTETINIFSVASGHLYERLLRIMMVSLLKHTKKPVKFWFLKNYLSPQFTDFLPHMAKEYNFQYELVQYKWPRWLHQQTEKQRTIWGYKILFLDVLFPLNVRKIIFVDADAIVRTDINELYQLNLGGAPYAYTPFCDSRKDMEGFRFWKHGYWRSHLMGRRYHISALYVVDLKRFRKIAAGDRLRGQYQALSQDPNSLANLDQDLPNNMIHQVAIKSLPDEWLWCQTWCSDSSFKSAKVIDLCNNPMTKEAKLTAAQRIVPEWKDYDSEIKTLMSKIEDHENIDELSADPLYHQSKNAKLNKLDKEHHQSHGEL